MSYAIAPEGYFRFSWRLKNQSSVLLQFSLLIDLLFLKKLGLIQYFTSKFHHASKSHIATTKLLINWVARLHDETPTALIIISCESYTYSQLDDQPQKCAGAYMNHLIYFFCLM